MAEKLIDILVWRGEYTDDGRRILRPVTIRWADLAQADRIRRETEADG